MDDIPAGFKWPKLNFRLISIAIALGIIAAIVLNEGQIKNFLNLPPLDFEAPKLPSSITQTIVQEENAIIDVVEKSSASVVAIGVSQRVIDPLDLFALPRRENNTIGTGFVVSSEGIIVTNKHVVLDPGNRYTVVTRDGERYEVRRIYRDPVFDLALVKIDGSNLKALELGDSSQIKVGQTAIAIGNALGRFTNTVTTGIVSGLGRAVTANDPFEGSFERLEDLIQTDAAINPGNSGGPLLNSRGQVIGLNTATTEGAQNIGFAIPINSVKPIIEQFIEKGTVSRPYLGIRYRFIDGDLAIINKVPQGIYIQEVIIDSPAEKSGIRPGDIITKISNQSIDSENKVSEILGKSNVGDRLNIEFWRDGQTLNITSVVEDSVDE